MLQYDKINRILSGIQWSYYRDFIDFRKKVLAVRSQWRAGSDPIGSRSGERVKYGKNRENQNRKKLIAA